MLASGKGHSEIVQLLLQHGADVDTQRKVMEHQEFTYSRNEWGVLFKNLRNDC